MSKLPKTKKLSWYHSAADMLMPWYERMKLKMERITGSTMRKLPMVIKTEGINGLLKSKTEKNVHRYYYSATYMQMPKNEKLNLEMEGTTG